MEIKKRQKNADDFYCNKCLFKCSKKSDWSRHLSTRKHNKETFGNDFYACENCEKTFNTKSGHWKHQQKCSITDITDTKDKSENAIPDTNVFIDILKQNQEFKELMMEQSKQIQGMQIEIQEQQHENNELHKQLIHAVKYTGNTIQNQTINNNQKFNLNFFLNEQCKNAINMSEFLENMELNMEDLTETSRLGYVGGISRILVNKLQELDICKRPLHCTDMKRETLYIRENDEWSKENNSKEKLTEIVEKVSNKNCRNIKQWTEEHPEYNTFDSPENMEYMKLTQAVLGGLGEQESRQFRDKILRSVIKEVMVNKM